MDFGRGLHMGWDLGFGERNILFCIAMAQVELVFFSGTRYHERLVSM